MFMFRLQRRHLEILSVTLLVWKIVNVPWPRRPGVRVNGEGVQRLLRGELGAAAVVVTTTMMMVLVEKSPVEKIAGIYPVMTKTMRMPHPRCLFTCANWKIFCCVDILNLLPTLLRLRLRLLVQDVLVWRV